MKHSQKPRREHHHQSYLHSQPQLQFHEDRDRENHEQDIKKSVIAHREVEVHADVYALGVDVGVGVPPSRDGCAAEGIDQCQERGRDGDVANTDVAEDAESRMRGEAKVEKQHRALSEEERQGSQGQNDIVELDRHGN